MKVEIRTRGLENTTELREVLDRKVRFGLTRFGDAIERVHVSVTDQNGPKGGEDKLCRIRLITSAGPIVIDQVDAVAERALAAALDRASRTLARMLGYDRRTRTSTSGRSQRSA